MQPLGCELMDLNQVFKALVVFGARKSEVPRILSFHTPLIYLGSVFLYRRVRGLGFVRGPGGIFTGGGIGIALSRASTIKHCGEQ